MTNYYFTKKLNSLVHSITKIYKFEHLCNMNYVSQKNYFEMVNNTISYPHNNSYLFDEMFSTKTP